MGILLTVTSRDDERLCSTVQRWGRNATDAASLCSGPSCRSAVGAWGFAGDAVNAGLRSTPRSAPGELCCGDRARSLSLGVTIMVRVVL